MTKKKILAHVLFWGIPTPFYIGFFLLFYYGTLSFVENFDSIFNFAVQQFLPGLITFLSFLIGCALILVVLFAFIWAGLETGKIKVDEKLDLTETK